MDKPKLGTLTYTTDGETLSAFFTDQDGNSETVLATKYGIDEAKELIGDAMLLMQHRNRIENYNADGTVSADVTDAAWRAKLQKIADNDTGKGW